MSRPSSVELGLAGGTEEGGFGPQRVRLILCRSHLRQVLQAEELAQLIPTVAGREELLEAALRVLGEGFLDLGVIQVDAVNAGRHQQVHDAGDVLPKAGAVRASLQLIVALVGGAGRNPDEAAIASVGLALQPLLHWLFRPRPEKIGVAVPFLRVMIGLAHGPAGHISLSRGGGVLRDIGDDLDPGRVGAAGELSDLHHPLVELRPRHAMRVTASEFHHTGDREVPSRGQDLVHVLGAEDAEVTVGQGLGGRFITGFRTRLRQELRDPRSQRLVAWLRCTAHGEPSHHDPDRRQAAKQGPHFLHLVSADSIAARGFAPSLGDPCTIGRRAALALTARTGL
jgi:hypothetical protein